MVISTLFKSVDCNLGILEYEAYYPPTALSSISSLISQYTTSLKNATSLSTGDIKLLTNFTTYAENIPPPMAIPKVMNKQAAYNPLIFFLIYNN